MNGEVENREGDNRKELGSGSKRKSKFSYTSKKLYRKANQS